MIVRGFHHEDSVPIRCTSMLIYLNTNGYLAAWGKRGSISKELDKKVVVPGKKFNFLLFSRKPISLLLPNLFIQVGVYFVGSQVFRFFSERTQVARKREKNFGDYPQLPLLLRLKSRYDMQQQQQHQRLKQQYSSSSSSCSKNSSSN